MKAAKAVLGTLNVKQANRLYHDVVTGHWADTSPEGGTWMVDQKAELQGYFFKQGSNSNFADLYVEKDGVQGFSTGDLYVGYAQCAVSTIGSGDWNWSTGAQVGDYFSGSGSSRQDAGRFFISNPSFLA